MKKFFYLIMIFLPFVGNASLDMTFSSLRPYAINGTIIYTKKVVVRNTGKTSTVISLKNIPDVTGIDRVDNDFPLPMLLAEYESQTIIEDTNINLPIIYANWFKKLDPDKEFIFYFLSNKEATDDDIKHLIVTYNNLSHFKGAKIFGYDEDEIVVPLFAPDTGITQKIYSKVFVP